MTQNLTGRAAAAAAPMGKRVAAAGFGPCTTCRHPARLHGSFGCSTGECECVTTGDELRAGAPTIEAPVAAPSAAELALLDVRCRCGHRRTAHNLAGSHVVCSTCACRGFKVPVDEPEVPNAPVAPQAAPAPPPVAAAPAPAVAPAAAPEPVREQPAPRPVVELPPWLPGTGVAYVKRVKPAPVVEVTTPDESVARQVDDIIAEGRASAARSYARRSSRRSDARPAAPTAQVSRAVVGEPDAVGEVAVASTSAAAAEPEPLDLKPFLSRAVYSYAAWYCDRCHQRRHDPGACPDCRRTLQPVYVAIIPRSVA